MRKPCLTSAWLGALFVVMGWSSAFAETLLMPTRDYLKNTSEVVWGVTTLPNNTPFWLDYGDGQHTSAVTIPDRSYIAFNHTYTAAGTYSVTLCVGIGAVVPGCPGEQATVQVNVYDGTLISPLGHRGIGRAGVEQVAR